MKRIFSATLIAFLLISFVPASTSAFVGDAASFAFVEKYVRTELYFGLSKPDGSKITESEWQVFVDEYVTPRFPQGLTILEGRGQWRGNNGKVVREDSRVLVLLYARKDRKAADSKIEEIRTEYKKRFAQESVLRLDIRKSINGSF